METRATIELNDGRQIRLIIYNDIAPKSAANFLALARAGFYEGLCFHRVIPKFMIQGGGYVLGADGLEQKTSKAIEGEFAANKFNNPLKHEAGVISMARTNDRNSASCQFFICVADCAYLDGQYAAFGRTADEESLRVARDISEVKTGRWINMDDFPREAVVISRVSVEE